MSGIVAYVGENPCRKIILDGLSQLEYRGYDSAGFICIDANKKRFSFKKEAGGIDLVKKIANTSSFDGFIGLGHIRWATHGGVNSCNAHPQFNCKKTVAVVHNGIIEGFEPLREQLIAAGHNFSSSTDTEVAAHLFDTLLTQYQDIKTATLALAKKLRGAYALVFLLEDYPNQLIVIRCKSPLVLGVGQNEMFVASDCLAFSGKTNNVLFLPCNSCAFVKKDSVELFDFAGASLPTHTETIDTASVLVDKQGYEHFMLKEIYEQKHAIIRTISFFNMIGSTNDPLPNPTFDPLPTFCNTREYSNSVWQQLGITQAQIKGMTALNLVAAGTSWHAARIGQFFFEMVAKIPTRVLLSSEFRYMPFFTDTKNVHIMISQSGETADTLEALRLVNALDMPTIALTNVTSSSLVREATGFLPMQAGPEISVTATKTFSGQISSLYWLAHRFAYERGVITAKQVHLAEEDLYVAAEILETAIETHKLKIMHDFAPNYAKYDRFILLGRHLSYPLALEASLKLKEISYIFSQCYPAGELKHGPIALIDEQTPVILFSVIDEHLYQKIILTAHEVKARNGKLIVFAFEGQKELIELADISFVIPRVKELLAPLAMTGIMQLCVYQIAKELNRHPDKPRSLAKAVTFD